LARPSTKVKVGTFVLVAVGLIVIGVAILGSGSLFRQTERAETYINESVQGLDVGSSVKFRGVQIGRVTDIGFVQPEYDVDRSSELARLVLVRFEIFPRTFGAGVGSLGREVEGMVQRGLRVRLAQQGLTGTEYLEARSVPAAADNLAAERALYPLGAEPTVAIHRRGRRGDAQPATHRYRQAHR
jgi:phospholipid/cholesterol/gamma-HCH transport system substrate-binding protein